MSVDPKKELIDNIEKKMALFQQTCGAANSNIVSTLTIILNDMGQTILKQYAEIESLRMENANLKAVKDKPETSDNL